MEEINNEQELDPKFKELLDINGAIELGKQHIKRSYAHYSELLGPDELKLKEKLIELMSDESLDIFFGKVMLIMQEAFDQEFTEAELNMLIDCYKNPAMIKWLKYTHKLMPIMEEFGTEWTKDQFKYL